MAEHAKLFLHLTGAETGMIKGESVTAGRGDWIEINDWNWSMQRSAKAAGAETVEPSKITFSKLMDRASTAMLLAMHRGTRMNATIKLDDAAETLLKMEVQLKNVRIIGYEMSVQPGTTETLIEEDWEFDYEAVIFEYRQDSRSGAVKVRLERQPGASTAASPDEKLGKFLALSKDMSVVELRKIWDDVLKEAEKARPGPKKDAEEKDGLKLR